MPGPEHECIVAQLDRSLVRYSATALVGLAEAERSKFDYACQLNRDLSRPLVAQVLWSNPAGIEKDLRTLIHDEEAVLKLYLVRGTAKHLRKVDEVVQSYRRDPALAGKLVGLRRLPIADFDADLEEDRLWLSGYLDNLVRNDVLFGIVFGQLTPRDFEVFQRVNGPFGLKVALLDVISTHGFLGNPEIKERINYGTTGTIGRILATLTGAGLAAQLGDSVLLMPTVKGRLLLDILKRLYFEWSKRSEWSAETALVLRALNVPDSTFPADPQRDLNSGRSLGSLLYHCTRSEAEYNSPLLAGVDALAPKFYGDFDYAYFRSRFASCPDANEKMFDDPESLFFPSLGAGASAKRRDK